MAGKVIEAALKLVWDKIDFLKIGKTNGSIGNIMESAVLARLNAINPINPIKAKKVTLIPMYMGRMITRI